jgi:hypothetical protein
MDIQVIMTTAIMPDADFRTLGQCLAGRYRIVRQIGQGGMAIVYLARDVALERNVAVKVLPPGRSSSGLRDRFLREARTAAGLSHPNIVPIHLVEAHDALVLFVMGYVDGDTLRERVERTGPLSAAEAARVLQEVAWALGYAHQRGIVHRDVKPENILIERASGRAMVADFGIAHAGGSETLTIDGLVLGTPHFMSPEQAAGMPADARADVYALGVTAFYVLTGRLPLDAPNAAAVLAKHVTETPPPVGSIRPDLPRQLTEAVDRCLLKDPAQRFDTGDSLAAALGVARSAAPEIAPAIARLMRDIDLLGIDTLAYAILGLVGIAIAAGLSTEGGTLSPEVDRLLGLIVGVIAFVLWADRVIGVGDGARTVLAAGFRGDEIRRSFRARSSGLAPTVRGPVYGVGWWVLQCATLVLVTVYWVGGRSSLVTLSHLSPYQRTAVEGLLVVAPAVVARNLVGALFNRSGARITWWDRLWAGGLGRALFRLVGAGLSTRRERDVSTLVPTEEVLAGSVAAMFQSLPAVQRAGIADLPGIVAELEGQIERLRERRDELSQAIAEAQRQVRWRGASDGVAASASDLDHRLSARAAETVQALEAARTLATSRKATALAALDGIRLGLLRVRSGLMSPDALAPDLDAAREAGRGIAALLGGEPG